MDVPVPAPFLIKTSGRVEDMGGSSTRLMLKCDGFRVAVPFSTHFRANDNLPNMTCAPRRQSLFASFSVRCPFCIFFRVGFSLKKPTSRCNPSQLLRALKDCPTKVEPTTTQRLEWTTEVIIWCCCIGTRYAPVRVCCACLEVSYLG